MRPLPIANPTSPWQTRDVDYLEGTAPDARLQVFVDGTRGILSKNDSPDLGFRYSVNPYRGCFHGCAYCFARPSHEYLSFGAGTDFDRKIVIKPDAAALLRAAFEKPSWAGEAIVFSGVTDCYQPLEASYRLTRACLEVCAEYKNPVGIITKSPLLERDLDVLDTLARVASVSVAVSIPFMNPDVARALEPYVATPARRLRLVERLAARGIAVGVNVAPYIPGLSEDQVGPLLAAAKAAGAERVGWVMLRLPGAVAPVFEARLREALPLRAEKILARVRETRGGKMYDSTFGSRQTGTGTYAETAKALFESAARKVGLRLSMDGSTPAPPTFARPAGDKRQLELF